MTGAAIIPRIGFRVAGSGKFNADSSCDGTDEFKAVCEQQFADARYDDQTLMFAGMELLLHATPWLRLGRVFKSATLRCDSKGETHLSL